MAHPVEDTMTTQQLDQAKAEAFGGQMVGILNNAFIGLMVSVGHRTGLFDTMADMHPSTVEEIARKSGLNERYVREWLGAMTVARIVEHDPKAAPDKLRKLIPARLPSGRPVAIFQ